ncbi:MAG: alanine dehydrogenase [bacterium]|nr:alanine dehydrogenase [bacterium]MDE0437900.1 alanine dehydrogenase [bacterium]
MNIGVVTETKPDESRVALTPAGVHALKEAGHQVMIEIGAGLGSYIPDDEFAGTGATMTAAAESIWSEADIVVKVKEPQADELSHLSDDQILFTFLHLAAYPAIAEALCEARTTAIAYETVRRPDGVLPLLAPMSEVAGRMSAQVGARFLEKSGGGRGVLLGGVPGVESASVVVIGAGTAGTNAVQIAVGMRADVTVFDLNPDRLREIDQMYRGAVTTLMANRADVRRAVLDADLVIGAVLLPGAKAPRVLTAEDVEDMKPGSVVVDIAIDQGGCFETSRETRHSDPTYVIDDVVHYAVGNIPGAVPRTSTYALSNATLPYLRLIADEGLDVAMERRPELCEGVNTRNGEITNRAVLAALGSIGP